MAEIFYPDISKRVNTEEQIKQLIVSLNILRKNMGIYPLDHPVIIQLARKISSALQSIFSNNPKITINAISRCLIINGDLIETKNTHLEEFASFINRIGMASLTLSSGLSTDDLLHFCQLALRIPLNIHLSQCEDLLQEMNKISNIRVRDIDLSSVSFSDDDLADNSKTTPPMTIWQKLMLYSLSPQLLETQDKDLYKTIKIYDQGSFKRYVEAFNIPEERLLQSYITIITDNFDTPAEHKCDLDYKQDFFRSINENLLTLSPELKEKIMNATFDIINSLNNEKALEELLKCIPDDLIVEIFTQAFDDKKELSPLLVKLTIFLYSLGKHSTDSSDGEDILITSAWFRLKELFKRDSYEKYLTPEYADTLHNLTLKQINNQTRPFETLQEEYFEAVQDLSLNRHLASALLFLLQGNLEDQLFSDFVDKLANLVTDFIDDGNYGDLPIIYELLHKHLKENKRPSAATALENALNTFFDDLLATKLAEAYKGQDEKKQLELEGLILLNGSKNLPWLVGFYLEQRDVDKNNHTLKLISKFGSEASSFIVQKLAESSTEQTILLLQIIQHCPDKIATLEVRKLAKNRNLDVRLEAIKTMLAMQDNLASAELWNIIQSGVDQNFYTALSLINDYRVYELAVKLAATINTGYINKKKLDYNIAILKVLRNLGDEDALPTLINKAGARFSLTPASLRKTQEHIMATLSSYPPEIMDKIISSGLESRNRKFRKACRYLSNRGY